MSRVAEFARSISGAAVSGFCVESLSRRVLEEGESYSSTQISIGGFELQDETRDDGKSYLWTAKAFSQVNIFVAPSSDGRTRVLVADVEIDASQYAVGVGYVYAEELASQLHNDITAKISESDTYVLVDRNSLSEIDRELDMIRSGRVNRRETARIGQMAAADVIVIPKIISLDYGVKSRVLRTATLQWLDGGMEMSFTVMNLITSEVLSSMEISKQFPKTNETSMGIRADARSVVNQAVTEAAAEFAQEMLLGTTELYVVDLNVPRVIVNGGSELLSVGDRLIAHGVGEELFHPVSNESLGREEVVLGEVVIDRVSDQLSYGTISVESGLEGSLETFETIKLVISRE